MKMYTHSRIVLNGLLSEELIIEAIVKINKILSIPRIYFYDDSYEADFVFDLNKTIALMNEYKKFSFIKVIMPDDVEVFFGKSDNFIYLLEHNDILRNIIFELVEIKWAYTHDYTDYNLQTDDDPELWKAYGIQLPADVQLFPDPSDFNGRGKMKINKETLPGHEHRMWGTGDGLWFGAFWQMYFSDLYYKYIPVYLWEQFSDCSENKILKNGLRKITLYDNPDDFNNKQSRNRQWAFRNQLGIDSIGHEVSNGYFESESVDLPVIITKQNCTKGSIRVVRYLNSKNKQVNKSKATFIETTEYDDTGEILLYSDKTRISSSFFKRLNIFDR